MKLSIQCSLQFIDNYPFQLLFSLLFYNQQNRETKEKDKKRGKKGERRNEIYKLSVQPQL